MLHYSPGFTQLIGGAILALGIYLTLEGQEFGETLTGVTFTSGSVLLLVSGAVTLAVTIAGIVGAIGFWKLLLYVVRLSPYYNYVMQCPCTKQ